MLIDLSELPIFAALIVMSLRFLQAMIMNTIMLVTFSKFHIVYLASVFGLMQFCGRLIGIISVSSISMLPAKLCYSALTLSAALANGLLLK
jgi:hypothetical protein